MDIMQLLSSLGASLEQWIVVQSARAAAATREAQDGPPTQADGLTSAPSSPLRLATASSSLTEPPSPDKTEPRMGRKGSISFLRSADLGPGLLSPAASVTLPGDESLTGSNDDDT